MPLYQSKHRMSDLVSPQHPVGDRRHTQEAKSSLSSLSNINAILEYKKRLAQKKIVKVVKKRNKILWFFQFWSLFIFL